MVLKENLENNFLKMEKNEKERIPAQRKKNRHPKQKNHKSPYQKFKSNRKDLLQLI